jgi:hypothetical protein
VSLFWSIGEFGLMMEWMIDESKLRVYDYVMGCWMGRIFELLLCSSD